MARIVVMGAGIGAAPGAPKTEPYHQKMVLKMLGAERLKGSTPT